MVDAIGTSTSDGTTVTALSAILGGEQKAGEVIATARERARQKVAATQEEVPGILARGEEVSRTLADERTTAIREDADAQVRRIAEAREMELVELRTRLTAHLPYATKMIVRRAADPALDRCGIVNGSTTQ